MVNHMSASVVTSEGVFDINNIDGVKFISNSSGEVTKISPQEFSDFKFHQGGHYVFIGDKIVSLPGEIIKAVIFF